MLVLSRHRDEKIIIGDNIIVTVVDIRRDRVRLGITAPAHIPVHREEVYEAIQREQREAAKRRKKAAEQGEEAAEQGEQAKDEGTGGEQTAGEETPESTSG